jgi:uncharacterized membrane protein YozB (DUF420 family)
MLVGKNRTHIGVIAAGRMLPNVKEFFSILITFILTSFAWIFFRSDTIGQAIQYISRICSGSVFTVPTLGMVSKMNIVSIFLAVPILIAVEWINRNEVYGFKRYMKQPFLRWTVYIIITLIIIEMGGEQQDFIYFQF